MFIRWFSNFLVNHPFLVLFTVSSLSGICLILPFTLKSVALPSFQDPQLGFITRGTEISNRMTAYSNLIKETKPSGKLLLNPKEYLLSFKKQKSVAKSAFPKFDNSLPTDRRKITEKEKEKKPKSPVVYGEVSKEFDPTKESKADIDKWRALKNLTENIPIPFRKPMRVHPELFFCGEPDERYAHFVVKSATNEDMFSLSNVLSLCRLENSFKELKYYRDLCILNTKAPKTSCCQPWSLPNYIAIMRHKPTCLGITEDDVDYMKKLLIKCAHHFNSLDLKCLRNMKLCTAPLECLEHDTVYNILSFLVTSNFITSDIVDDIPLPYTMVFLPLASSTAILPYYHEFEKHIDAAQVGLKVVAVDFGIKSALFDEYLLKDAMLMFFGATFIFLCIWLYTKSLFLTVMALTVIVYSLAVSYVMYTLVYRINYFPFMNILAAVIVLGIGSDDAFIFSKVWGLEKQNLQNVDNLSKIMAETFRHAGMSMLITALTTGSAFLGSLVGSVTAINCFSIFAGTAVAVNYILMITMFPASIIILEKYINPNMKKFKSCLTPYFQRCSSPRIKRYFLATSNWLRFPQIAEFWNMKKTLLIHMVIKLKILWIISLTLIGIASTIVVFIYPKLKLPNSTEFQLFTYNHVFEQFDFVYKKQFWFNKPYVDDAATEYKLPMRFVWGVLPVDNGNHLDPTDRGSVVLDPDFDIADPDTQKWLRDFCQKLKDQPFIHHDRVGPHLSNCFMETFERSMSRPCIDKLTGENRKPCCELGSLPFNRSTFNMCAIEEMGEIWETPKEFLGSNVAGPKFSKNRKNSTIKALIVEYDSNYSYSLSYEELDKFYTNVEQWTKTQLETAPASLKNGFFTSDLEFYDLQRELSHGTIHAVILSMGIAFSVLFLCTLNVLTSVLAIITIMFSILVTMAIIAFMGWTLNILESLAISTAIGLTIDFSLHYSANYRLCPQQRAVNREASTTYALSYMTGPALMVAITTSAAGGFMTFSYILPYIQIGIFLVLVMIVSWIYATFFLCSLLATIGPTANQYQYHYASLLRFLSRQNSSSEDRQEVQRPSVSESHELQALTALPRSDSSTGIPLRRSHTFAGVLLSPEEPIPSMSHSQTANSIL